MGGPDGDSSNICHVTFVGHSTVLIEQQGVAVLTDPVLRTRCGPLVRTAAMVDLDAAPDAVIVSHLHRDHFDLPTLRSLGSGTRLFVPAGAGGFARRSGLNAVSELGPGDETSIGRLTLAAVPARHDGRRSPFGVRAASLGYVISGSTRIYFAGDTGLFDGMADIGRDLDLALLPVSGWGPRLGPDHLGPRDAARALSLLRPRVAIPIHWGTLYPAGMRRLMRRQLSEPPHEFARVAARMAPDVEVRILAPGESIRLAGPT